MALLRDLRFAARQLRFAPGYSLAAIATLALAIGASTAIFSAVYAVLLKPERSATRKLARRLGTTPAQVRVMTSYLQYATSADDNGCRTRGGGLIVMERRARLRGEPVKGRHCVSGNFFELGCAMPRLGPKIRPDATPQRARQ